MSNSVGNSRFSAQNAAQEQLIVFVSLWIFVPIQRLRQSALGRVAGILHWDLSSLCADLPQNL